MKTLKKTESIPLNGSMHRRHFLRYVGGTAAAATVVAACSHNSNSSDFLGNTYPVPSGVVSLGSGDVGILNYAFALEQIESTFYQQVIETKYSGMTSDETALFTDIRDHEWAHREFFKTALGTAAIPILELSFSGIDFSSRDVVLSYAHTFEDLGVSAYNGAGKLLKNVNYLLVAGKIVSVEARHAAYIRDLASYGTFASSSVVDSNGLDEANDPPTVLKAASKFIKTQIDASHLPTS